MLKKHFQYRLTMFGFEIKIMDKCCVCGKQPRIRSGLQTHPVWKHNESVLLLHRIRNAHGLQTHCKRTADRACVKQTWGVYTATYRATSKSAKTAFIVWISWKKLNDLFSTRAYRTERPLPKIFDMNMCTVTPLVLITNCSALDL